MVARVYLAWQRIGDGLYHVRRWSPDLPGKFMGFQKRTAGVIEWLRSNRDPKWPDCHVPDTEPFEVINDDTKPA